tara:strand:+ start:2163 stop:3416 length:1254 start_codon:yes stop_codon:yes gene_type:complete
MLLKLGWKNIVKRPLSSGLSVVLLSCSIMIIVLASLTMQQLQNKFDENANKIDLVVGAKGSRLQMVLCNVFHIDNPTGNIKFNDVEFLSKHPFVKSAIPISLGDSYKSYRIVGTELSYINDLYNASLNKGRLFDNTLEVVAGAGVANQLDLKIGDRFYGSHGIEESIHDHDNFEYELVGILNSSGEIIDNLLLTSLESVWDVHPEDHQKGSFDLREEHEDHHHHHHEHSKEEFRNDKEITAILINYNSPRAKFSIPGLVNKKQQMMAAEPAIEIQQLLELVQPAIKVVTVLAWFIFGLAFISMVITMINSMKDRKYEIAMMRVAGASYKMVLIATLIEGFMIALIGSLLGVLFGHSLMELMGGYLTLSYHYQFTGLIYHPFEFWLIFGTLITGMVSALFPAISAYKMDISITLKDKI